MIQGGYEGLIIDDPGLTVCTSFPYLAASFDGIVPSLNISQLLLKLWMTKFFFNKTERGAVGEKPSILLSNSSPNIFFRFEESGPCCLVRRSKPLVGSDFF